MSLTRADITQIFNDTSLDFPTRVAAGDALRYDLIRNGEVTDGLRVAREVIELCLTQTEYNKDTYDALERAYITCAPHDFHCYMTALEWNRARKDRFYYPRRKIMKPLADVLTDMIVNDLYDIVMISSPPRVGKAQPLDAKVLTPNGFVTMGSLKVGDKVIAGNGKVTHVTNIFPRGKNKSTVLLLMMDHLLNVVMSIYGQLKQGTIGHAIKHHE